MPEERLMPLLRKKIGIFRPVAVITVVCTMGSGAMARALAQSANTGATARSSANEPIAAPSVKPINKRFLLSKPTVIYAAPDDSSPVLEHVRAGIHVDVTGLTGKWLQLKLRNDKTGYIPATAAE
jgi:uncharacterized protein YgiM (DUF1202 family)